MEDELVFFSPTLGKITGKTLISEIAKFLDEDPEKSYSLVIGTDSQEKKVKGGSEINFVSAIVIHRKGYGGRYFWRRTKKGKLYTLRDKIYTETLLSLDLAQNFIPQLKTVLNGYEDKYSLEIHIDVGNTGPSREMIKEVVGMVTGNGFCAKTKPESYGAFIVADKHT